MSVFLCKSRLGLCYETVIKFLFDKVDCASAETASHDAGTCHATLLGYSSEEIKLFARHLIILGHAPVSSIHTCTDSLIVTFFESRTHIKHTLLLSGTENVQGDVLRRHSEPERKPGPDPVHH